MDIHQLQCFYYAAKMENMTRAADKMNMSQPALSISIKKLEDELCINLFDRNGKKVMLSRAGKAILPLVSKMLLYKKEIERVCSEKNDKNTIFVKLQAASPVMLNIISKFSSLHPEIKVFVCENESLMPDIIVNASVNPETTSFIRTVCQENICIAVPRVIEPNPDQSMIEELLYDFHVIGMSERFSIGKCEEFYFKINNIRIKHAIICDSIVALRTLLSNGTGIAFVPDKTWQMQDNPLLTLLHYPGALWQRFITIEATGFRPNQYFVKQFIDYVETEMQKL